jgi:putative acetyltransferase
VSLVALDPDERVIGHVLFTPVEIHAASGVSGAIGLAPLAVRREHQDRGVGSALVRAGLARCREIGEPVVVVLGHPSYYPRFGFRPAWELGLYYEAAGREPVVHGRGARALGAVGAQR